jgi:hypothetical protein
METRNDVHSVSVWMKWHVHVYREVCNIYKVNNTFAKCMNYVTEYTICHLVSFQHLP